MYFCPSQKQRRLLAWPLVNLTHCFIYLSNSYYLESFISQLTLARLFSPKFWFPFIKLEISWQKAQQKGRGCRADHRPPQHLHSPETHNQPCRILRPADPGNCNISCIRKFISIELWKTWQLHVLADPRKRLLKYIPLLWKLFLYVANLLRTDWLPVHQNIIMTV